MNSTPKNYINTLTSRYTNREFIILRIPAFILILSFLIPFTTHAYDSSDKSSLILGRWKDEDSVMEYFKDGTFISNADNGEKYAGTWNINGDTLTLRYEVSPNDTYLYKILEISTSAYKITGINIKNRVYNARRIKPSKQSSVYTTKNSRVYHNRNCSKLNTADDLMEFTSPQKAKASGGIPCKHCNPSAVVKLEEPAQEKINTYSQTPPQISTQSLDIKGIQTGMTMQQVKKLISKATTPSSGNWPTMEYGGRFDDDGALKVFFAGPGLYKEVPIVYQVQLIRFFRIYVQPRKLLDKLRETYGQWSDSYKYDRSGYYLATSERIRRIDDPSIDKDDDTASYFLVWGTKFNLPSSRELNTAGGFRGANLSLGIADSPEEFIAGKSYLLAKIRTSRHGKQTKDTTFPLTTIRLTLRDLKISKIARIALEHRDNELLKKQNDPDRLKFR